MKKLKFGGGRGGGDGERHARSRLSPPEEIKKIRRSAVDTVGNSETCQHIAGLKNRALWIRLGIENQSPVLFVQAERPAYYVLSKKKILILCHSCYMAQEFGPPLPSALTQK